MYLTSGKRIDDIILPKVAEKLNLPLELIEDMQAFQWASVVEQLNHVNHVEVRKLGRFRIKKKCYIQKIIDKENKRLELAKTKYPNPNEFNLIMLNNMRYNVEFLTKKLED